MRIADGIRRDSRTYRGRRVIDGLLLKTPILGTILRKIAVARFCRTLATLTSSGVPILESLDITARTSGNAIVEDAILETRKSVEGGKTIVEPNMEIWSGDHCSVYPPLVEGILFANFPLNGQGAYMGDVMPTILDLYKVEPPTKLDGKSLLVK